MFPSKSKIIVNNVSIEIKSTLEIFFADLRALFPISPTPMDHDYYFSMDNEEGLMDLFDISTTELF